MARRPSETATHRVGRARFRISGDDENAVLNLRAALEAAAGRDFPRTLEAVFDVTARPGETLEIDRLEVDLGRLDPASLDLAALGRATEAALRARIGARNAPAASAAARGKATGGETSDEPPPTFRPLDAAAADSLLAFLLTGLLPARSPAPDLPGLLAAGALEGGRLPALLAALGAASPAARLTGLLRLIAGIPPPRLAEALGELWPAGVGAEAEPALVQARRSEAAARRLARRLAEALWPQADAAGREAPADPAAPSRRAEAGNAAEVPPERPAPAAEAEPALPAPNAGVVLLHPFLPRLFSRCGLWTDGVFAGPSAQATAARLVHFLATGDAAAEEAALPVPRLLCGLPDDLPALALDPIAGPHLAEAEALLEAAIGHWRKLGRASPASLREAFLSRPGLVRGLPHRPRLVVERRGVDALLGALPWALDPVRLPWLRRPIRVDWA